MPITVESVSPFKFLSWLDGMFMIPFFTLLKKDTFLKNLKNFMFTSPASHTAKKFGIYLFLVVKNVCIKFTFIFTFILMCFIIIKFYYNIPQTGASEIYTVIDNEETLWLDTIKSFLNDTFGHINNTVITFDSNSIDPFKNLFNSCSPVEVEKIEKVDIENIINIEIL
jgi:hypothetical protein